MTLKLTGDGIYDNDEEEYQNMPVVSVNASCLSSPAFMVIGFILLDFVSFPIGYS